MRKLMIVLLLIFLSACNANTGGSGGASEFETDMREAYGIINEAFEDDMRELTSEEEAELSYFLESEEYEALIRNDSKEVYTSMQMYYTLYSGYHIGAFSYSELLDAKLETDKHFE